MRIGRALVTLLMLASLALPAVAGAAEKPQFFVGAGYGKWIETGAPGGSVGFEGGVLFKVHPQIAVGGELGYQMLGKNSVTENFEGYYATAESKYSLIPVTGQVYWMIPVQGTMQPMLTFGLGLYNFRWSGSVTSNVPFSQGLLGGFGASDSETKAGFNFGGGLKFGDPNAKMRYGVNAKYHIVSTEGKSTNVIQIMGRVYFG
jgi:hypothetical protein